MWYRKSQKCHNNDHTEPVHVITSQALESERPEPSSRKGPEHPLAPGSLHGPSESQVPYLQKNNQTYPKQGILKIT